MPAIPAHEVKYPVSGLQVEILHHEIDFLHRKFRRDQRLPDILILPVEIRVVDIGHATGFAGWVPAWYERVYSRSLLRIAYITSPAIVLAPTFCFIFWRMVSIVRGLRNTSFEISSVVLSSAISFRILSSFSVSLTGLG